MASMAAFARTASASNGLLAPANTANNACNCSSVACQNCLAGGARLRLSGLPGGHHIILPSTESHPGAIVYAGPNNLRIPRLLVHASDGPLSDDRHTISQSLIDTGHARIFVISIRAKVGTTKGN